MVRIIRFLAIICVISASFLYAVLNRDDEEKLWKCCSNVDTETFFTLHTENPLVKSLKIFFPKVRRFDDMLVEIQNFPIYHNDISQKNPSNLFALVYADFVFQFFSGNVPGWLINPNLKMNTTQQNKSVHALVCAGGYASASLGSDEKVKSLISAKNESHLNEHFKIYEGAYTAGKTKIFVKGTITESVMKNTYMGNIQSINDYFNYMIAVSILRSINGYWTAIDISFAWENAPKFFTNKQIQGIKNYAPEEINKILGSGLSITAKTVMPQELNNSVIGETLKKLLDTSNLGEERQQELLYAYRMLEPYFDRESSRKVFIIGALSSCVLTQGDIMQVIELLAKFIDPVETVDPDKFWDTMNTFNESVAQKGIEHFISMLHNMKRVIIGKSKLKWLDFHDLVRAFYRAESKNHIPMAAIFQIVDEHMEVKSLNGQVHVADEIAIIDKFEKIPSRGHFYTDLSEATVENPEIFQNLVEQLYAQESGKFNSAIDAFALQKTTQVLTFH